MSAADPPPPDPPPDPSTTDLTEPIAPLRPGSADAPTVFDPHGSQTLPQPATSSAARPELEGDIGPYKLIEALPSRRLGEVHRAHDIALDREVVLWIPPEEALAEETREVFLREAQTLAQLVHPNLLAVYSIERDGDRLALAKERVRGRSLAELVGAGELDAASEQWPRYLAQAAMGLQAAAQTGVLHRDISPDHLVLRPSGQLVLTHFALGGLSERSEGDLAPASRQREAPELASEAPSQASDLYALGASICQLLAPAQSPSGPPTPGGAGDPRLARVLRQLTANRPDARPTYDELLDALEPLLPGELEPIAPLKRIGGALFDLLVGLVMLLIVISLNVAITGVEPPKMSPVGQAQLYASWWLCLMAYHVGMVRRFAATIGLMIFRAELRDSVRGNLSTLRLILRFAGSWLLMLGLNELFVLMAKLSQSPVPAERQFASYAPWVFVGLLGCVVANLACMFFDRKNRALHDLLMGSWIVRRHPERLDRRAPDAIGPRLDRQQLEQARSQGARIGKSIVLETLGQGGMGQVFRGYDETLDRQVAIKVLRQNLNAEAGFEERFIREARLLAGLSHPNVVQLYHFGIDGDQPYFTMELIPGRSLGEALADGGIEEPQAIDWMIQACEGLAAAKTRDIIHRDIKPSNMIISPSLSLKMVDFGMAKMHAAPGEDSEKLTQTGVVMGTPHYMSPEQGQGEDTDHRSDIYSLGATFYHLLTGQYPYTAKTPMGVVVKHITSAFPEEPLKSSVSRELFLIIQRMMAKHPSQRFQSYPSLIAALQRLRPGQLVPANVFSRSAAYVVDLALLLLATVIGATLIAGALRYLGDMYTPARATELVSSWRPLLPLLLAWPSLWTLLRVMRGRETPGMSAIGLEIVSGDGRPASPLRRLGWWLMVPSTYLTVVLLLHMSALLAPAEAVALLVLPPIANALLLPFTQRSLTEWATGTRLVYG